MVPIKLPADVAEQLLALGDEPALLLTEKSQFLGVYWHKATPTAAAEIDRWYDEKFPPEERGRDPEGREADPDRKTYTFEEVMASARAAAERGERERVAQAAEGRDAA